MLAQAGGWRILAAQKGPSPLVRPGPTGSIKIRVETIDYFLKRCREDLGKRRASFAEFERQMAAIELDIRRSVTHADAQPIAGD
jgi:hypothetical protein